MRSFPKEHKEKTLLLCPCSVETNSPVDILQIIIVLSSHPEQARRSFPKEHTDLTELLCPFSVETNFTVDILQILIVLSKFPVAMRSFPK